MSDNKLTIYPLGSGGWIPANGLETLCFCFILNDEIFIIDIGTGISRLMELKDNLLKQQWSSIKRVHIFLSHYHFDHIAGLFWVRGIFKGLPVMIYAPGEASYGKSATTLLNGLFKKPYSPYPFSELIPDATVTDLSPPGLKIHAGSDSINLGIKLNPNHSDPTISFRFNDWFAFVTDTPPEDKTIDFVRGVKILFHESYFDSYGSYSGQDDDLENHRSGPHTGSFGAGLIAKRAGVDRLYLIHHNPEVTMREVIEAAVQVSKTLDIDCRPARDLTEISIDI